MHVADADTAARLSVLIGRAAASDAAELPGGNLVVPRPSGARPLSMLVAPARAEFGGGGPRLALVSSGGAVRIAFVFAHVPVAGGLNSSVRVASALFTVGPTSTNPLAGRLAGSWGAYHPLFGATPVIPGAVNWYLMSATAVNPPLA